MPYFIHKDVPDIITIKFDGAVDLDERKKACDEVCDLIDTDKPINLLVDVRNIKMQMSTEEQISFGKYLASKKELISARVAVVHVPANNPNQLINAVAYTEGYETVDFDNEYYASEWLNGNIR